MYRILNNNGVVIRVYSQVGYTQSPHYSQRTRSVILGSAKYDRNANVVAEIEIFLLSTDSNSLNNGEE